MNATTEAPSRPTILVVDDALENLSAMSAILRDLYTVKVASSGEKALAYLQSGNLPDLILLDLAMPTMDGCEVLRRLQRYPTTRSIPVITLTSKNEAEEDKLGLDLGAVDYIPKPLSAPVLLARVRTHLQLKEARDFLRDKAVYLQMEVNRRVRELASIQDVAIVAMTALAQSRDNATVNHIHRTQRFVRILALELSTRPKYAAALDDETIDLLFKSAPLHDIGKIAVPDRILLKPGQYTPAEFELMKRHCVLGKEAIENAERQLRAPVRFLALAKEIAYSHQEKWDGTGYPQGLQGDQIPLSARIMAVADVYDALIRRRIQAAGLSHEAAMEIMLEGRGTHFDPEVVDALVQVQGRFRDVVMQFWDTDQDMARKYQDVVESLPDPSGN
jgi:putative two-component system response regulator